MESIKEKENAEDAEKGDKMAKKLEKNETIIDEEKTGVKTSPKPKKEKKKDAPVFPRHKSEAQREVEALQEANPGQEEQVVMELALRKYVARKGGFRAGIPEEDKREAKRLMKLLGREKPVWDTELIP